MKAPFFNFLTAGFVCLAISSASVLKARADFQLITTTTGNFLLNEEKGILLRCPSDVQNETSCDTIIGNESGLTGRLERLENEVSTLKQTLNDLSQTLEAMGEREARAPQELVDHEAKTSAIWEKSEENAGTTTDRARTIESSTIPQVATESTDETSNSTDNPLDTTGLPSYIEWLKHALPTKQEVDNAMAAGRSALSQTLDFIEEMIAKLEDKTS